MNAPNSILLVTAPEYAEIQKFVGMGLDIQALGRAISEIVSVPAEELDLPIYFQVDVRAPQLRFVDYPEVKNVPPPPNPEPPAASTDAPVPEIGPFDMNNLFNSARKVFLVAEL